MANETSDLSYSQWMAVTSSGVLGAGSALANILIALSIAKYEALRDDKEYLLVMSLAVADTLNMLGYVALFFCEFVLIGFLSWPRLLPARQCLLLPHVLLFMLGWPLCNIILLLISLDRLFLVLKPLSYIQLGPAYMKRLVGAVYGAAIGFTLLGVLHVWLLGDQPRPCVGYRLAVDASGIFYLFTIYFTQTSMTAAVASVLVYCLVFPIYMSSRGKVLPSDNDQQKSRKIKSQRKMTITLGISCLCTFLLYILPAHLALLLNSSSGLTTTLATMVLWLVTQTNSLANIFIYELRHPELWVALKGLLRSKELPSNLQLWPIPNINQPNVP